MPFEYMHIGGEVLECGIILRLSATFGLNGIILI